MLHGHRLGRVRVKRPSLSNVLWGVAFVALGATFAPARDRVATFEVTRIVRLPAGQFGDSVADLPLEADGLRARLAGREERYPQTILVTDTLVLPPDTVIQVLRVNSEGNLTTGLLIVQDSAETELRAPEIHRDIPVGDCDDGWSWSAGQVVCDRSRFGHLSAFVDIRLAADVRLLSSPQEPAPAAFVPAIGAYWERSFRSPWRASVSLDSQGRVALGVTRGFQLF